MGSIRQIADSFCNCLTSGRKMLLAFDYDGTLAPLAPVPDLAMLPRATRRHLTYLASVTNPKLGILSGRSLPQLDEMVNIAGIWQAGSGGLMIKTSDRIHEYPCINYISSLLLDIAVRLSHISLEFPGAWIESKPGTLTIHFRGLATTQQTRLMKCIAYLIAVEESLESLVVSQAVEIRPRCGWHKGTAIEIMRQELWESSNPSPFIMYFGDSSNDREAFDAANRYGGISVGVGPEAPSNCLFRLDSPSDVEMVLETLCRMHHDLCPDKFVKPMCA